MISGETLAADNEIGFESLEWNRSQGRVFVYFEEGFPPPIQVFIVVDGIEHIYTPLQEHIL